MKVLLTTLNAKYIHKNLALRWLYVAAPKQEDVSIKEYTIKEEIDKIVTELLKEPVEVIAFSVYIWNIKPIMEIIKKIKQVSDKHIIVGGPEVTYDSYDLLEKGVDAISLGEGEVSFWQYIQMLESGSVYEVEGIYTKQYPNTSVMKVDLAYNESLDNPYFLPFDLGDMQNRYFYFETSRGCPYGCEYWLSSCDRQVRMFSEEYVFSILEKIATSKVKIVKLLDRTFNVHPQRALRIARYMNEHCKHQIFQFEIVAETLSEELLTFFCQEADKKRFRFEIGVQSFHKKTLESVGRIQNNERLIEVITRLQKANVVMHVDLIAGLPYEDVSLFKQSFNALYDLHADEIQLGILKLLKGTKLKKKQALYDYHFNEEPPYDIVQTKWLSEEQLYAINQCAHAVEKYYNNGRCRYAIDHIIALGLYKDAFSLFMKLGEKMDSLKRPYQPHQLFQLLKETISDADEMLVDGLLNYDYYRIFKQKPKMYLRNKISSERRKSIYTRFIVEKIIEEEEVYHYAHIDTIYYQGQIGYQLILYNKQQTYPRRWFVNEERIEEIA
ncbi:MAG: B12-binding domain-containing radical SAM protein [Erysipelotrichia bacterium]|nr:B12-binding domain-containing radical SAM protein [Erysipelotrichia bacterium]